jgi:hypothetical protein
MKLEKKRNRTASESVSRQISVNNELTPVLVDISTPPQYQLLHLYSEMKFETLVSRIQQSHSLCKTYKH